MAIKDSPKEPRWKAVLKDAGQQLPKLAIRTVLRYVAANPEIMEGVAIYMADEEGETWGSLSDMKQKRWCERAANAFKGLSNL